MKRILIGATVVCLLTGCMNSTPVKEENDTDSIFKEELTTVFKISDAKGKKITEEITIENIKGIFDGIFDLAIFESHFEEYGEITQGTGSDGNGGRVFCCKMPVKVNFIGTEDSVEKFVEYFENIENAVSFGEFKVEPLEDKKYEVNALINFLGKAAGGTLASGKKEYTIKKNEIEVKEESEIALRDFDVSMIIRPSNSDSSAISLGVVGDKDYRIFSGSNSKKDIDVKFTKEGSKYYCEYSMTNCDTRKAEIKPGSNILFDIVSCDIIEEDDEIATDIRIINESNKKVSVVVYDDKDGRVNIVEKVGSVEVKK